MSLRRRRNLNRRLGAVMEGVAKDLQADELVCLEMGVQEDCRLKRGLILYKRQLCALEIHAFVSEGVGTGE